MTTMRNVATDQQTAFSKQASILRKNLAVWNHNIHANIHEDWPKMLGRTNAASNQCTQLNTSIEDVMDHFVIVPKQSPANPSDIPFFLATRIDLSQTPGTTTTTTTTGSAATTATATASSDTNKDDGNDEKMDTTTATAAANNAMHDSKEKEKDAALLLHRYETTVAKVAREYEDEMIRF
eukprot:CAMPEP_0113478234 /NCGR_PEP_ID=MMETSP0014_2-20120614/20643_1 /TAXON_ID=2857 /ORGANISM="Nitzschia sp." /LENGTH=179 /DNA_ID=CAMNT_0000371403 /DNA_START=53 /DNA_END=592 /DNA_ORIENTATION=- /assembly_acc=CAM_ASM_000159